MIRKILLRALRRHASHWIVLFIDLILVCFSFILAYTIRFSTSQNFNTDDFLYQFPFISIIFALSFWIVGTNRGIIRHTGTRDAFNVFIGVSIASFILVFLIAINSFFTIVSSFTIPKTIILTHYFITVVLLICARYIFKSVFKIITSDIGALKRVMIYGSGDSGLITYGALNRDPQHNYKVIGFIDDDTHKAGKKIDSVKIFRRDSITKQFIKDKCIDEVILSIQNIKSDTLLFLTDELIALGVQPKIVPPFSKWIEGDFDVNQIKQVKIEDLLNRTPISIDNPIIKKEVNNKTLLVTGAAGSIGSEIARQLSNYKYKHLILIDQAESPLYELQQELIRKGITKFTTIVGDVRDNVRMDKVFNEFEPNIVFHAAAYKHVPLMEQTPYEAIKINIGGTKNIANLAVKHKTECFVMVSTDKAVNPTNVMGATKRVAEMYISCLSSQEHNTKFTTTRFGNVLGSNGSVIPLFKKQIENGGPLTVTHKDITRYFMTIPEACQLVLEAGTMGIGGEIYIFDMGKSVKIYNIAKRMIHLSGLKYPEDIDITITGLRPGEKLYEELLADGENTSPTYHEKIMIAKTQEIDTSAILNKIEELCVLNKTYNNEHVVKLIKEIVPEYISNNSIYQNLDASNKSN